MEIRRIKGFRTIVEAGGLTKAAQPQALDLMHVTPSALSKSMRQLEREVGQRLFNREGRALRLTEHGQRLYHVSGTLIEQHARILRELDGSQSGPLRQLRLATYEVFSTHCLGALLETDLSAHPCQVLELGVGALERALEDRQADVGITYVPVPRRGLTFVAIGEIEFRIYVKRGTYSDTPFADVPFAIPTSKIAEGLSDVLGIDCWPYERVPRLVMYRLTSLESAFELCRRGMCAVFAPQFLVGIHNQGRPSARQLIERDGPPSLGAVTRTVYVVHREQEAGDALISQVVAAVKKVIASDLTHQSSA